MKKSHLLDEVQYIKSYDWSGYRDAKTYDDLITQLSSDLLFINQQINDYKLDKRRRKLGDDEDNIKRHEIATVIERQLDVSMDKFRAWLIDVDRVIADDKYFKYDFSSLAIDDSPANRLILKVPKARDLLKWLKKNYSLHVCNSFFYEFQTLHIENFLNLSFKLRSTRDTLLEILFTDPSVVYRDELLIEEIAELQEETIANKVDEKEKLDELKNACDGINRRVSERTGEKIKLIIHEEGRTALNPNAFHLKDRFQFISDYRKTD